MASSDATWHVYLLRCADDTLYCGVTTDLDRRLAQHNGRLAGGARYTRPRRPVALQVMELGLLFMLAAFLVFTAVSALGGRLAHWFNSSPRGQMLMHRVAGLVFVALAVMLIFSCVA